ncbi:glyoxalase [Sorangium cellulosum]|uniref:Glyoxalase n=1 Tax=Sorangium cellulosum TaxID=56 RepID=A0A2L0ELM1_SORCE|nr:VOC family protein [Sorangium cellulosum]AUX40194.1 glyoxalase [Sorangium cellulosum]
MAVKPVPDEKQALSPYLVVRGAAQAIAFYVEAFGAKELYRLSEPSGKIGHAELVIGGSRFMLADEYPDFGALGPLTVGGTPVSLHLYVEDVDRTVERATKAGATLLRPVKDEFFGDRTGMVADPFGHKWHLATHKEDVSPEEMQRRMNAAFA